MPLNKVNSGNAIRGLIVPNQAQRSDCQSVIALLNYSDLGRSAGTLHTVGSVRLDMQGRNASGDVNLQVQIGGRTAAAAIIGESAQSTKDQANQVGVSNAVISILNQSLDSGTIWKLSGSLP